MAGLLGKAAQLQSGRLATHRRPRLDALALLSLTVLAAALGLFHLDHNSIWLDEAVSVAIARQDLPGLVQQSWGPTEAGNMFLYYLLMHAAPWSLESEVGARLLSILSAVLTVPLIYLTGRRMFDALVGLLAAGLLTLNAFFVQYAQEARSYALALLLVTAATYLFVRAIDRPTPRAWLTYAAVATLALYAHYFAGLVVLAHLTALPFRWPTAGRRWPFLAFALVALASAPLALAAMTYGQQIDWLTSPTPTNLLQALAALTGSRGLLLAYGSLWAIAIGAAILSYRRTQANAWSASLAALLGALPVAVSLGVSVAGRPIFLDRYLIVSLPGFVLLAGAGLAALRVKRPVLILVSVAIALLATRTLGFYYADYQKEDWRGATALVARQAQPGDGVILYPAYARVPFDFYMLGEPNGAALAPLFPSAAWGAARPDEGPSFSDSLGTQTLSNVDRVWVVCRYGPPDPTSPDGIALRAALARDFRLAATESFPQVVVLLYERVATRG